MRTQPADHACRLYLRAVIAQGVMDIARLAYMYKYGGSRRYVTFYKDAIPWISNSNSSFETLCSLANLTPSAVRGVAKRLYDDPCNLSNYNAFRRLFGKAVASKVSTRLTPSDGKKFPLSEGRTKIRDRLSS